MTRPTTKRRGERREARDLAVKSGKNEAVKGGFYPAFTGGVRVATGDITGDGKATIVAR
jgi:hypothetical protein